MSDSQPPDILKLQVDAAAAAHAAEAAWKARDRAGLLAALKECDRLLQAMPPEVVPEDAKAPDPDAPLANERALLWLWRGRLLVMGDKPDVVVQGLHSLDQAIARFAVAGTREGAQDNLAIAWMNRGSGLFRMESREALAEAVRSYEQAIALLERPPLAVTNALGAAWMNRGVGLMHLQNVKDSKEEVAARLAEAAKSLDRAIVVLEPLAPHDRAAQHNLASVWSNLGMLRARMENPAGAVEAHRKAVDLFRPLAAEANDPGETFELAARLYNYGQSCGAAGQAQEALAAGREALAVTSKFTTNDPQAVELVLRIRHAICVVLGGLLAANRTTQQDPERPARLEEAGDLVEDGLAALRTWGGEMTPSLAAAAARLYEFGAWFYRTQQPQFLAEFLLEHMGEDTTRARIAAAAVQAARQGFVQRSFSDTTHGDMDRVLGILQELGEVEARVKSLGVA